MAMDITEPCPHCMVNAGSLCKSTCPVNGDHIKNLKKSLEALGLLITDVRPKVIISCDKCAGTGKITINP